MNLLEQAHEWVQVGFAIIYEVVDQIENGYGDSVADGTMPKYTYTFSIYENREEIWYYSVDSLEQGYEMAIKWLKKNRKQIKK